MHYNDDNRMLTAIDLFCGAGGLSHGLAKAGFHVVGALDSWDAAVSTHRDNFTHPVLEADIRKLSAKDFLLSIGFNEPIDLDAGGPPCQGFSVQRIGNDHDDRNDLIFEFARFVREIKPRMFLMENVPGLLGKRGAHIATRFEALLSESGYAVECARMAA